MFGAGGWESAARLFNGIAKINAKRFQMEAHLNLVVLRLSHGRRLPVGDTADKTVCATSLVRGSMSENIVVNLPSSQGCRLNNGPAIALRYAALLF